MFEEMHENGWNVAEMSYPFGRGINFSIEVEDVDMIYHKFILNKIAARWPAKAVAQFFFFLKKQ